MHGDKGAHVLHARTYGSGHDPCGNIGAQMSLRIERQIKASLVRSHRDLLANAELGILHAQRQGLKGLLDLAGNLWRTNRGDLPRRIEAKLHGRSPVYWMVARVAGD